MIGIAIATHGAVASALLDTVIELLGQEVPGLSAIQITDTMSRNEAWNTLVAGVEAVESGEGVLVLVDMFGGTPATLSVDVITGVNLAMVLRCVLKRDGHSLSTLSADVLAYGKRNITSSAHWLKPPPEKRQ
jgi:mannose/fructose-specific phosphotransferase system component IIA